MGVVEFGGDVHALLLGRLHGPVEHPAALGLGPLDPPRTSPAMRFQRTPMAIAATAEALTTMFRTAPAGS
jgi:hypothetical protein